MGLQCKQFRHLRCSGDFVAYTAFYKHQMTCLMSSYLTWFLIRHSNDVHIFVSKVLSLLGEVAHHRKQSSQVEAEESFRICVQEGLQGLVERGVVLGHVVIQVNQAALHCGSYGLEHQVVAIQVSAGLLRCVTVPHLIGGHVSQQARQENRLLHVADSWAVSPQSQEQAVPVEFGLGRLHGSSWMWSTVPVLWWLTVGSSVQCKAMRADTGEFIWGA